MLTSFAKKFEAFSCASSIILSCLSTSLFITSSPLSTTASCTLGFFNTDIAKAGSARFSFEDFPSSEKKNCVQTFNVCVPFPVI